MEAFYTFAATNPWLTFFLALIILQAAVYIVQAIASMFRKPKEKKCCGGKCKCSEKSEG